MSFSEPSNQKLNEADTRGELIDPVLRDLGWKGDLIKREFQVKDSRKRPDYVLKVKLADGQQPVVVGVLEAKAEEYPPSHGLEQAKRDAMLLNVPYGFSTNGHRVVKFDRYTGRTKEFSIKEFPTPEDLRIRYESKMGFSLDSPAAKPLLIRYTGGDVDTVLRDYQDAAIRAVLEKIARCEARNERKHALLYLATGAGKTRIAVHLLKQILGAGLGRFRALFVCDRDELRSQASKAFRNVFGSNAALVTTANSQTNAQVLISTYHTLFEKKNGVPLLETYDEGYFTHIVIDECHRSAWGQWSQILTRNPEAVKIGLTATPRRIEGVALTKEDAEITANNYEFFGEPVYEYSMLQGIEDGYLAPFIICPGRVEYPSTLTAQEILKRNPVDTTTGRLVSPEKIRASYSSRDIGRSLLLPDVEQARCQDLFNLLLETGESGREPEQKTIIFCAKDYHADIIARYMEELYADWCNNNNKRRAEPYAFKCTDAGNGQEAIPDFRARTQSHFIATTVDLLSTGVDIPVVKNIVFFAHLDSAISFYQMVGRGSRLDFGKQMFRVYDYTNSRRLFGGNFITKLRNIRKISNEYDTNSRRSPEITLQLDDTYDLIRYNPLENYLIRPVDGEEKPITVEEYKQILSAKLIDIAPTLEQFRTCWIDPKVRQWLIAQLVSIGVSSKMIQTIEEMREYDLYDVLSKLAYGLLPRTRRDRAATFRDKYENWLDSLPELTRETVEVLVTVFENRGIEGLENKWVFQTPGVTQKALEAIGQPGEGMREIKLRIFSE